MSAVNFVLFGNPQIFVHGDPLTFRSRKILGMLSYLALHKGTLSRQQVMLLLWPEASTEVAQTSLRNALHELRQTSLISFIEIDRYNITLSTDIATDVLRFKDYINKITRLQCETSYVSIECLSLMQQAVELYQADFLADFTILGSPEFEDWQMLVRVDLQYEATMLFAKLAHYYAEQGINRSALRMLHQWIELDPANEDAYQMLMHVYALSGQPELAVQHYHNLSRQIKREFDRLPSKSIQMTYRHIKERKYQQKAPGISSIKPIRSLAPIPPQLIIGRENDLHTIKSRLLEQETDQFTMTLSGPSGIGKTTLAATLVNNEDIQHRFSDGILWGNLGEHTEPEDILRLWLDAMRISVLKSSCRSEHLALQLRMGLHGKKVLLVVDNVRSNEELTIFNLGGSAATLLITPHTYRIGLLGATHPHNAITLAPLPNAERLVQFLSPDLIKNHSTEATTIIARYHAYPEAIHAICHAYQEYIHLRGANKIETLFDKLLDDTFILALPSSDGKSLFQRLEQYWKLIDPDTQNRLKHLISQLNLEAQYTQTDFTQLWSDDFEQVKLLLDYGLLIREAELFYLHRLLVAYLREI